MAVPVFTEGAHPFEFLVSEASGYRSRDKMTVESGAGVFKAGQLMSRKAGGSASAAAKSGGNTGNGAMTVDATTPVLDGAQPGVYVVRCITAATNSGTFEVFDPSGASLGLVAVAATFANQIKFVIADGGTDFIVGDAFDVTVNPSEGKWVKATATVKAEGVALYGGDATSADVVVSGIVRDAEVRSGNLTYEATIDDATKKGRKHAELVEVGIIVR